MEFNYALERRKFEKQWAVLRKQYADAGMGKESIQQLYEFDLQCFNSERRYISHQADIPVGVAIENFPYVDKKQDIAPINRRWWIDEIEDVALLRKLLKLSDSDIELLTVLVFEEHTQSELAQEIGRTQQSISRQFQQIKKYLKNGV